ncbi:PIR Superfamily Protein [Plasmodium ovale wallikeri]|uniref:PIR Superfamily Protein n=1 Tax=Plasmodium ovale wallikeri TaxID=864142 RepID=A0A1A9A739_PLAOA|nr:PIR Superfamily Protein [Plasmodium ovale wallikeri]SBT55520.1 PIR Superfamily Protein [Plasmodium ovale wallikeri]
MGPPIENENYNFCNNFDIYIPTEVWVEQYWNSHDYTSKCYFSTSDFSEINSDFYELCARFKCLFKYLFDYTVEDDSLSNGKADYMNFWLNDQLKEKKYSAVTAKQFYDKLSEKNPDFHSIIKLDNRIHNIEEKHLENMKKLKNLYKNYNEIKSKIDPFDEIPPNSISYTQECLKHYEGVINLCTSDNSNYCNALEAFKVKCEQIENSLLFKSNENQEGLAIQPVAQQLTDQGRDQRQTKLFNAIPPEEHKTNKYFSSIIAIKGKKNKYKDLEYGEEDISLQNSVSELIKADNRQMYMHYNPLQNE